MKFRSVLVLIFALVLASSAFAQNKKNSRPQNVDSSSKISTKNSKTPVYFYEFTQPKFIVSKIRIEHDENGYGKITFQKKDYDEDFVESLELSVISLEKLKGFWTELKFLDSDEKYQSEERDYGHLGTTKLMLKNQKKERTAEFNWTENLIARALANEYRKIGNQYVWMFDMNVSRENQPLESPKIMKRIDSYLKRDEISDPKHMIPFLKDVSDDERFPLITRNHATRLLKRIEKTKKTKENKELK